MMSRRDKGFFLVLLAAALAGCSGGAGVTDAGATGSGGSPGSGGASGSGGAPGSGGSDAAAPGTGGATTGSGGSSAGSGGPPDGGGDTPAPADGPTGDSAPSGPVMPVLRNNRWTFDLGDLQFEVDPQVGGRITTFALAGSNILTGATVHPIYWGSTFWTSPESQWSQPPPIQIDSAPFTATSTATTVTLVGPPSPLLGVSISKTFSADRGRGTVQIEYKITNTKQTMVRMAPWEVTRVFPRGLTFFPTGSKTTLSNGATLPTTTTGGVTWFSYDATQVTNDSKLIADAAEGWLAHVDQGVVFIKTFADVPPAQLAPSEGDVELYTNKVHTYIELENQGPDVAIAPGASTAWTVTWFLKRLPAGLAATAGDPALVQFVRDAVR